MSIAATILQRLVDAGGSMDREEMRFEPGHQSCFSGLKAFGYIVTEHRITDEGRAHLQRLIEREAKAQGKARRPVQRTRKQAEAAIARAWGKASAEARPVLVTTDEQIEKLKRKAEADRSFGFESASQRMRIADVSDC